MNWVTSGVFSTSDEAAVIANNYTTPDRFTLNNRCAALMVECTTAQTDFSQDSGIILAGCDTRVCAIDLNVGILAADWECSAGSITTSSSCGIVGARMRPVTGWVIGQDNGIISAKGSGGWNTSASGIGGIFAKHDTALTAGGASIGFIGASMANGLTLEGNDTGIVVAQQSAKSTAAGVVAAQAKEIDGVGAIMAAGGTIKQ